MNRVRVTYDACGGHLHAWRSGSGGFWMSAPSSCQADELQRRAESQSMHRARRRLGHTAAVSSVTAVLSTSK
jgi:hypothetical protein